MASENARDRILDAAEQRLQQNGYFGFSFRDVAEDVGSKSASVHYHFPAKSDFALALTKRYGERAMQQLGEPESAWDALDRLVALFRGSLGEDKGMCLCGMLGAERDGLPDEVNQATEEYFGALLGYLNRALGPKAGDGEAESILSALEGGLLLSRSLHDPALFERVAEQLAATLLENSDNGRGRNRAN